MIIKKERPPIWDAAVVAFPAVLNMPNVIFSWGDTIYNPGGATISPQLIVHESVHGKRQGRDIEGWWQRYLIDAEFRVQEEIPAHAAEYAAYCSLSGVTSAQCRMYMHAVASRLSSPLYGRMVRYEEARRLIKSVAA